MVDIFTMDNETFKKAAMAEGAEPPSPRFTLEMALVLQKAIIKRRDVYSTSIAEDSDLLQNAALQGRRRMAIEVRLGEKEILACALEVVEENIRILGMEEPSHKDLNKDANGVRNKRRRI